ncbi:hypothetical protein A6M57_12955 [Staphylococcus pseudintermedius]|nr:hypothetical protein A6M57_12955 [Staphylococcus pseudintermedius]
MNVHKLGKLLTIHMLITHLPTKLSTYPQSYAHYLAKFLKLCV